MAAIDPDQQRAASRAMWQRAASGWGARADAVRDWGMPVSLAMLERLALQPGQQVLELAAGPGDTGFMAAELIGPDGTLTSSDGAEAMVQVARRRAEQAGLDNVEFKQFELEWIDLPTASVDAVLCRWGIMLTVDPEAAAHEARRVLRAGGRASFAVWDVAERNPWATLDTRVMVELGHLAAPDPQAPGMFRLAAGGRLQELLEGAGFVDVRVEAVAIERRYEGVEDYLAESRDMSPVFSATFGELAPSRQAEVVELIAARAAQFQTADGSVRLPGSSLVAVGEA